MSVKQRRRRKNLANGTQYLRFYVVEIDFSNDLFSFTSKGSLVFEFLYQNSIAVAIEFFVLVDFAYIFIFL